MNEENNIISKTNYDTLVLSGGSVKGLLTLGALQYAKDNNLIDSITTYIGTSSGAIISYLLAINYTPIEIVTYICTNQLLEKMKKFNLINMLKGRGAISFEIINKQLEKMTIEKVGSLLTMKELYEKYKKKLVCTTYNFSINKVIYISHENMPDLPCLNALRMSSNLPLVFEQYKHDGFSYIDGGIANNFPIDLGDKAGNKILGILLSTKQDEFINTDELDMIEYIYKLTMIPMSQYIEKLIDIASSKCKIIRLSYPKIKFFNFNIDSKTKLEMFSFGYQTMKEQHII